VSFALHGVGLTHANGFRALCDISLRAAPGERIALIGPSGAGKTSLLSVLGTALAPTGGLARYWVLTKIFADRSIQGAARPHRHHPPGAADSRPAAGGDRGAGRQARPVAGLEVAGFAALPDRCGRCPRALERVDLADKLFARCDQLSGGQLQRVGIARVLYQQPELILADEPVSALDPALALATVRLLIADAEARGATLVASLHAVDLAIGNFTRIVGVKAGCIAFDLPAGEVTVPLLHELYAGEGGELPVQAHEPHFLSQAAANEAATRAACC
jgi:phosphonate transport system ATP-binding protein